MLNPKPKVEKAEVSTLIEGSPFRGTNGIAWGPDNMLYQGSVWTDGAFIVNPETGGIRRIEGAHGSDDLAFHPDGRLYLNYIVRGVVGVRQLNGDIGIAGTVKPGNNGIAVSKEGKLRVSGLFMDPHLWDVDPDGKKPARIICDQGKHMSNGMMFGPDGKLYGSSWVTQEVIRIDPETGAVEVVASKVGIPSSVKFNNKGELHVMNIAEGTISKVNMKSGALTLVAKLPYSATDNFCFSPDDRLFATSAGDGYIWEVTGVNSQRVVVKGGLGVLGGVAITEDRGKSTLMVVDMFAIRKFNPDNGKVISAVRDVTGDTDVGWMLTVNNFGKHVVTSSWTGNFIKIWDQENDSMVVNFDKFKAPTNAIAIEEDIVFCDMQGTVQQFSPKAKDPYKTKTLASGLKQPFGLAYDNGNLYVSDELSNNIVQVLERGKVIEPKVIASDINSPQGIALYNGELLVVEAGTGKLLAVSLTGGTSRVVAEGMSFVNGLKSLVETLTWPRASINVSGNIAFIAGTGEGCIYKVTF
jgi:sugar lactone lactonase YvrE